MARRMKEKSTIGIIGLGRFGMSLAQQLAADKRRLVCIDKDEKKVKAALSFCEYAYVTDDLSLKNLDELGFRNCDIVVICIAEQTDVSILTTLNVVALGVKKVYAKALSEEQGQVLSKLGADVLFPEKDSADRLASRILSNNILDVISLNNNIQITEVKIPARYIGVSVRNSDCRTKYGLNIIAIERGDIITTNIDPDFVFEENDAVVLIGNRNDIISFES